MAYRKIAPTEFEIKWGIDSHKLAKQEGISTTALHMRVYLYGTPFQRAKKPTKCEREMGKTSWEIGEELGINFTCVEQRLKKYGTPYIDPKTKGRGIPEGETHKSVKKYRNKFWLHPNHPRYAEARACKYFGE